MIDSKEDVIPSTGTMLDFNKVQQIADEVGVKLIISGDAAIIEGDDAEVDEALGRINAEAMIPDKEESRNGFNIGDKFNDYKNSYTDYSTLQIVNFDCPGNQAFCDIVEYTYQEHPMHKNMGGIQRFTTRCRYSACVELDVLRQLHKMRK